jgi:hypothetical protein
MELSQVDHDRGKILSKRRMKPAIFTAWCLSLSPLMATAFCAPPAAQAQSPEQNRAATFIRVSAEHGKENLQLHQGIPDFHIWTNPAGIPQLDDRTQIQFVITKKKSSSIPIGVNFYGGGSNNGDWRCDSQLPRLPQIVQDEVSAMATDDSMAANHKSAITQIGLNGTGIIWGPQRKQARFGAATEKLMFGKHFEGRSYLEGPIRITANYIRLDGPIANIGNDVTLIARRIVINGVELPASGWREALQKIVKKGSP